MSIPLTAGTPLTVGNTRVKEARKLSRRPVRSERRLFLADGPKAVEGALSTVLDSGESCVVEVFATPAAEQQYAALLAAMHVGGVTRLVLASSMVVYGEGRYLCPEHGEQAVVST